MKDFYQALMNGMLGADFRRIFWMRLNLRAEIYKLTRNESDVTQLTLCWISFLGECLSFPDLNFQRKGWRNELLLLSLSDNKNNLGVLFPDSWVFEKFSFLLLMPKWSHVSSFGGRLLGYCRCEVTVTQPHVSLEDLEPRPRLTVRYSTFSRSPPHMASSRNTKHDASTQEGRLLLCLAFPEN